MKYLIWIVVLSIAAVVVADAARNPAYILLVYPPYRAEMSLNLFLTVLLVVFAVAYSMLRLASTVMKLPETVRLYRSQRAQAQAQELLAQSLTALMESRYSDVERTSKRAIELGDQSVLHPLLAAQAAERLGNAEARDLWLKQAESRGEEHLLLCRMTEARMLLANNQPQLALEKLQLIEKQHTGVLRLLLNVQQQLGNSQQVLALLDGALKQQLSVETTSRLIHQAWLSLIQAANDAESLIGYIKQLPPELKLDSQIVAALARGLLRYQQDEPALDLLVERLNSEWDSQLLTLYADCEVKDHLGQIGRAEKWLHQHPGDANLLFALGKLCLRQALWGKAQSYLDASNSMVPCDEVYLLLAKLAEQTNRPQEALSYYQKVMFKYKL